MNNENIGKMHSMSNAKELAEKYAKDNTDRLQLAWNIKQAALESGFLAGYNAANENIVELIDIYKMVNPCDANERGFNAGLQCLLMHIPPKS